MEEPVNMLCSTLSPFLFNMLVEWEKDISIGYRGKVIKVSKVISNYTYISGRYVKWLVRYHYVQSFQIGIYNCMNHEDELFTSFWKIYKLKKYINMQQVFSIAACSVLCFGLNPYWLSNKSLFFSKYEDNEEPCKIGHQWQHLTHKVLTTCIVTRMLWNKFVNKATGACKS